MLEMIFNAPTRKLSKLPHAKYRTWIRAWNMTLSEKWGTLLINTKEKSMYNLLFIKVLLGLRLERVDHYYRRAYFH